MHIMVLGAAGMVGRKLSAELIRQRALEDTVIDRLTLMDQTTPLLARECHVPTVTLTGDLSDPNTAMRLVQLKPDIIYHLAAIVSREAEEDFDKGYRINLDGTRHILDAIRAEHLVSGCCPKLIFASSIAVFGAPFEESISDTFLSTPQTSYGTQKAICELLIDDYTRRGFLDGISLRLPTVCIRPGAPNRAASGFFSNILREPLVGKPAILPVPDTVRHWHISPRTVTRNLLHAAALESNALGHRRALTLPGLSATVAEQIEALRQVAGNETVALIRSEPDEFIMRMVGAWPQNFAPKRSLSLGFQSDKSFQDIIEIHIEDELGSVSGQPAASD